MTPSPRKPSRFGGLQVRICGHLIQETASIVCQRQPDKHGIHSAIAIGDGEHGIKVYAFLKHGSAKDAEVEVWLLAGQPE
jgi:hypothetical protein